jgi:hypothetical protein
MKFVDFIIDNPATGVHEHRIAINPKTVTTITAFRPGLTQISFTDGRGVVVQGDYADVILKLERA